MKKIKVKLLYVDGDLSAYHNPMGIIKDQSDWIEVSQEDLDTLHKYKHALHRKFEKKFATYGRLVPMVVLEPEEPAKELSKMLGYLKGLEASDKKASDAAKAKRDAAKKKREEAKKKKIAKAAEEKEQLEKIMLKELLKKHGNG
tara:strand:- start:158856 stop:159287 length:432 start_codon:yes stop_codon:yes gene_type:complete